MLNNTALWPSPTWLFVAFFHRWSKGYLHETLCCVQRRCPSEPIHQRSLWVWPLTSSFQQCFKINGHAISKVLYSNAKETLMAVSTLQAIVGSYTVTLNSQKPQWIRPYSDRTKKKAKKIKEQADKISEKSAIIKENFYFHVRFRLVWLDLKTKFFNYFEMRFRRLACFTTSSGHFCDWGKKRWILTTIIW